MRVESVDLPVMFNQTQRTGFIFHSKATLTTIFFTKVGVPSAACGAWASLG
jgi:hypothetical protein